MGIANAKEIELSDHQGHHPQAEAELPVWTGRKDWTCMSMWRSGKSRWALFLLVCRSRRIQTVRDSRLDGACNTTRISFWSRTIPNKRTFGVDEVWMPTPPIQWRSRCPSSASTSRDGWGERERGTAAHVPQGMAKLHFDYHLGSRWTVLTVHRAETMWLFHDPSVKALGVWTPSFTALTAPKLHMCFSDVHTLPPLPYLETHISRIRHLLQLW